MNAEILSIGTEVVIGSIADTNAAWLSQRLTELGFTVTRHSAVGDSRDQMLRALRSAQEHADVVLITGGLGPTLDDMTRDVLGEFAGAELVEEPLAVDHIRSIFQRLGRPMSETNLRQALIPEGAELVANPRGTAPGFALTVDGTEFIAMPGVPLEMKMMFDEHVAGRLRRRNPVCIAARHLRAFGYGESTFGEKLGDLLKRGANPEVGTQVDNAIIGIRVLARADSPEEAERLADATAEEVRRRVGEANVFGENADQLEHAVARELERTIKTLAVAESCSGGALSNRLTNVPGVSRFFLEGVVTYSNASKTDRLGVAAELIEEHGAVSAEVAEAMARGVRERSGADLGVGITGIAGPGGATSTKPVGLVYVALAHAEGAEVKELRLIGRREDIKDRTAKAALNMVRLHLMDVHSA